MYPSPASPASLPTMALHARLRQPQMWTPYEPSFEPPLRSSLNGACSFHPERGDSFFGIESMLNPNSDPNFLLTFEEQRNDREVENSYQQPHCASPARIDKQSVPSPIIYDMTPTFPNFLEKPPSIYPHDVPPGFESIANIIAPTFQCPGSSLTERSSRDMHRHVLLEPWSAINLGETEQNEAPKNSRLYQPVQLDSDGGLRSLLLSSPELDEEGRFILHLAVLTLYKDQIKPQHIEIKHRLQELHCSPFLEQHFLHIYEALNEWYVVETSPEPPTVFLKDTPNWFSGWVDMRDLHNPYPLHVWLSFDSYLSSMLRSRDSNGTSKSPMSLETRGGRYGMSKRLKMHGPPVFKRYSLGQVCHIVQLAVHLGLLSYDGGALMPAACCRSLVRRLFPPASELGASPISAPERESAVETKQSIEVDDSGGQCPLMMDLSEVQRHLRQLLNEEVDFKPMLLSQLKFRFLHKFKRRLDPVCFGFSRLSDFLAEKCSSSCRLVREGGRQVLVDRASLSQTDSPALPAEAPNEEDYASDHEIKLIQDILPSSLNVEESEPSSHRSTRGLLAVVAKHNRFHSSVTFSFWQFCKEMQQRTGKADGKELDVSGSKLSRETSHLSSVDSENEVFSLAGRFTDFLFASVLRPAATEPSLTSSQPSFLDEEGSRFHSDLLDEFPANRSSMTQLRWFTRRPLIERQLGQGNPLSDEDVEALRGVFFSVFPPRLPFLSAADRAPRPSKLRRQISSQIAQLRREIFSSEAS